jgi:hypothetical protein
MPTNPSRPAAASPAKSLDEKLARIIADPSCSDFILADAKDPDMAFGLAAPGLKPGGDPTAAPTARLPSFMRRFARSWRKVSSTSC